MSASREAAEDFLELGAGRGPRRHGRVEERLAVRELHEDDARGKGVDAEGEGQAREDLGRAVAEGLDLEVVEVPERLVGPDRVPVVDELDVRRSVVAREEHVVGLDVRVDHVESPHARECRQQLRRHAHQGRVRPEVLYAGRQHAVLVQQHVGVRKVLLDQSQPLVEARVLVQVGDLAGGQKHDRRIIDMPSAERGAEKIRQHLHTEL